MTPTLDPAREEQLAQAIERVRNDLDAEISFFGPEERADLRLILAELTRLRKLERELSKRAGAEI